MLEKIINTGLYYITLVVELMGIAIILYGTFYSFIKYVIEKSRNKSAPIKIVLANYLALGLEFMLAAEILRTVTTNREWSEIIVLGAIIILRAAMSFLINLELSYEERRDSIAEKKNNRAKTL